MTIFDGSQKEIGKGAQAVVYYYNGFAYKVYKNDYPIEWVRNEILIQDEINKTNLPLIQYYETEEPNVIKMDFINGVTLGDRILKEKYKNGVEDVIKLQKEIHMITDVNLPSMKYCAINDIKLLQIDPYKKDIAFKFLEEIPDKKSLLHLDFHFLNIMYSKEKYYIIDWINAKIGNPIYDFARSYVIMNEYVFRISQKYLSLITKDKSIDSTNLKKAVYVMALLRLRENLNERTLILIKNLENELI